MLPYGGQIDQSVLCSHKSLSICDTISLSVVSNSNYCLHVCVLDPVVNGEKYCI